MPNHTQNYRQLLSLMQSYLLDEFTSKDWITTDDESFVFFKKFHQMQELKKKPSAAPVPSLLSRPAPVLQQPPKIPQNLSTEVVQPNRQEPPTNH